MLATDARSVADLSLPSSDPGADTLPKVRSLAPRSLPRFAGLFLAQPQWNFRTSIGGLSDSIDSLSRPSVVLADPIDSVADAIAGS